MKTEQEQKAEVWAKEQTAYEYLLQAVKVGWSATRTEGEFDDWDVTITKNDTGKTVLVENKLRNIDADYVRDDGAMINKDKVDRIKAMNLTAFIVQYFWKDNETYKWCTDESDTWEMRLMWTKENSWSEKKVLKWRYLLPMDDAHRMWTVDLSDYNERYTNNYKIAIENAEGIQDSFQNDKRRSNH